MEQFNFIQLLRHHELKAHHRDAILTHWNEEYSKQLSYAAIEDLDNYLEGLSKSQHLFIFKKKYTYSMGNYIL